MVVRHLANGPSDGGLPLYRRCGLSLLPWLLFLSLFISTWMESELARGHRKSAAMNGNIVVVYLRCTSVSICFYFMNGFS